MTTSSSNPAGQTNADEEEILAVILKFFDGLRTKSAGTMLSTVLPNSHGTLSRPPLDGSTSSRTIQVTMVELIDRVTGTPDRMEENIALATWHEGDDGDCYGGRSTEVRVDHDLAVAWTPFEVRKNGELNNIGTNVFTMVRRSVGESARKLIISGVANITRLVKNESN